MRTLGLVVSLLFFGASPAPAGPGVREPGVPPFHSPMPGGVVGGYAGDTGLDIGGKQLAVYAIAAGTVDYAEWGHTRWLGPKDTSYCVRITLDHPVVLGDHSITHAYYAHLSALEFAQAEGAVAKHHVSGGDKLGTSGIANGSWHLHLGLLLDGHVDQDDWTFILTEAQVRAALGGYKNGQRI
jgi:murein DD-endopeptidase MepM/ murein hydrolase activator NlpD